MPLGVGSAPVSRAATAASSGGVSRCAVWAIVKALSSTQGACPAMTSTHRLAAILAADVAGYSRLMGADEEGTHERLQAHLRELVEQRSRTTGGRHRAPLRRLSVRAIPPTRPPTSSRKLILIKFATAGPVRAPPGR